jgi:hypothetical protein
MGNLKEADFIVLLCIFVFSLMRIICFLYSTQSVFDFLLKIINSLLSYTGASFPETSPAISLLFKNPAVNLMNLKTLFVLPALLIFVGSQIVMTFHIGQALLRKTIDYRID